MSTKQSIKKSSNSCERVLREIRAYNVEHKILPNGVKIIDRLLNQSADLSRAFAELDEKLTNHPQALSVFFDMLISIADIWNPKANIKARDARSQLVMVNRDIAKTAEHLAKLLDRRDDLHNKSGFYSETHYHPVDVLDTAAADNYIYKNWVHKEIRLLANRFDLKYWPTLSQCIRVIAKDAAIASPIAADDITYVATRGKRSSVADTFKSFIVALEDEQKSGCGLLPRDFELTDRSIADLVSCALNLSWDDAKDSEYVKRLRQRMRNNS